MRTREQLKAEGVLLLGPIVPEAFKWQSDGGSLPLGWFGRWLFIETQWRAAAFIHDLRYYLIGLQWQGPENGRRPEPRWVGARMEADFELKENRKLCARSRFVGWAYSRLIFRGLRVGARGSILAPEELWVPPSLEVIDQIESCCDLPLTDQAKEQIAKWRKRVD